MTGGATTAQLDRLTEHWNQYRATHAKLLELAGPKREHEYFKTKRMDEMEELYYEIRGEFQEHLNVLVGTYSRVKADDTFETSVIHDQMTDVSAETSAELQRVLLGVMGPLASLKALGRSTETWDDIIVFLIASKLDTQTRKEWESSLEAIESAARARAASIAPALKDNKSRSHPKPHADKQYTTRTFHVAKKSVKGSGICYNCLGNHLLDSCPSKNRCKECNGKHHSILHLNRNAWPANNNHALNRSLTSNEGSKDPAAPETSNSGSGAVAHMAKSHSALCQRLRLDRIACRIPITGLCNSSLTTCKSKTVFTIKPHFTSTFSCRVSAYVVGKVSGYTPVVSANDCDWKHLNDLELADPRFHETGSIDMLLGADVHAEVVEGRVIKGEGHEPIATQSSLGWLISGQTGCNSDTQRVGPTVLHCTIDEDVNELLQRFWLQEELPPVQLETPDQQTCEQHFLETHSRMSDGRYTVRLPLCISEPPSFHDTHRSAQKMLDNMERRFNRDSVFKQAYCEFMQDYIATAHMSVIATSHLDLHNCCFLPHHGVLKESSSTTKLRTVFNGSMKTRAGVSLNDCLHVGANLLPDLSHLVISWRKYKYAFVADIKQMFRQILLAEEDRLYQLILWRFNSSDPIQIYKLNTVTYGLASSPFLANRVIKQLAFDEKEHFPLGASVLQKEIYMDDVLSGGHSLETAGLKQKQVLELCKVGGFPLRKWLSNEQSLLEWLPRDSIAVETEILLQDNFSYGVLGLQWLPQRDLFQYKTDMGVCPTTWTKRLVLSKVAKLFDPLGLLAPVTITAKIFLQKLWLLKLQWDDPLPAVEATDWKDWYEELPSLSQIDIPRWIGYVQTPVSMQLHGFADASKLAYGAVLYLRTETQSSISTQLIQAKSKVAPIKTLSIPRLELSAAHLLAKLVHNVLPLFDDRGIDIYLWTDSLDVLHWLKEHPSKWPTFVANRCADIHNLVPKASWKHVRSESNPADPVSRGIKPSELRSLRLWWGGPTWLSENQNSWPLSLFSLSNTIRGETIVEGVSCHTAVTAKTLAGRGTNIENRAFWYLLNERCSNLQKLLRITAYMLRLVTRFKEIMISKNWHATSSLFLQNWFHSDRPTPNKELSVWEIDRARLVWVHIVQRTYLAKELQLLTRSQTVKKGSQLESLNPIMREGLIRVGGRLKHSLLSLDQKHPLILPAEGKFVDLLIQDTHIRTLHGGTQLTLATLRNKYWLIKGRQRVKSAIHRCHTCIRYRATPSYQQMASLPLTRVRPARPFSVAGVDYAGPFYMRAAAGRGRTAYKGYICLFICLTTRAVHLEAVSDYTTEGFLAAFRRFCARRGHCSTLISDQGTNFVGAASELNRLFQKSSQQANQLSKALAEQGTTWKFNPPAAPHFGGIWEAAVKSTKYHLRRVIGEARLTFEEFYTLLTQIEACLNSRPLLAMSDDPSDINSLTPAHFLIMSSSYIVPEPDCLVDKIPLLKRWRIVQQMLQGYWQRWSQEYLQSLQQRTKWKLPSRPMTTGDLVLIRNEISSPSQWPLARITALHKGDDGLPRVATLRTASTILKRPITKLIPLRCREELEVTSSSLT
ncbi:uncharacterized protein LOC143220071 [Lasioglossum baleicum]|uniref:uncharacterized protein LOC143220071 n=1 Tax=Lasioglossum baleicum TaxID=434251 RepID=UPI003FCD1BB7